MDKNIKDFEIFNNKESCYQQFIQLAQGRACPHDTIPDLSSCEIAIKKSIYLYF